MINLYEVLNIGDSATQEEIRLAWKKQMQAHHPDKNQGIDTTKEIKIINTAYKILKDPEKRAKYDEFIDNINTLRWHCEREQKYAEKTAFGKFLFVMWGIIEKILEAYTKMSILLLLPLYLILEKSWPVIKLIFFIIAFLTKPIRILFRKYRVKFKKQKFPALPNVGNSSD